MSNDTQKARKTVFHQSVECVVEICPQSDGNGPYIHLSVADSEHNRIEGNEPGESWIDATINVAGAELAEGETIIRNYSGGEQLLKILVDAGIVIDTGKTVGLGSFSNKCPIVKVCD